MHCGPPEECFKVFANVLNLEIVYEFYNFNLAKIQQVYGAFWKALEPRAPIMFANLQAEQVSCSVFLFEWVLTLFSSSFEIEICARLWDQLLFFGDTHIINIAVAICLTIERKFGAKLKEMDGLALIKKAKQHVEAKALFTALKGLKLHPADVV